MTVRWQKLQDQDQDQDQDLLVAPNSYLAIPEHNVIGRATVSRLAGVRNFGYGVSVTPRTIWHMPLIVVNGAQLCLIKMCGCYQTFLQNTKTAIRAKNENSRLYDICQTGHHQFCTRKCGPSTRHYNAYFTECIFLSSLNRRSTLTFSKTSTQQPKPGLTTDRTYGIAIVRGFQKVPGELRWSDGRDTPVFNDQCPVL